MKRTKRFTFRVNSDEQRMISALAKLLQRSRSDAVRFVVVKSARELDTLDRNSNIPEPNDQNISVLDRISCEREQ